MLYHKLFFITTTLRNNWFVQSASKKSKGNTSVRITGTLRESLTCVNEFAKAEDLMEAMFIGPSL